MTTIEESTETKNKMIRTGLNFLGILNDLKRRPIDAAKELDIPLSEIESIIEGKKELSQKIIGKVQNRFDKQYKPRAEVGILKRYSDITQVDMSEGNWLILSSANHFLNGVKEVCELRGWYYQHRGINSIPLKLLLAINATRSTGK